MRSIPEDIATLLNEADPEGIKEPKLVLMVIVADNKESMAVVSNIITWIKNHNISDMRLMIVDDIDDKEIWSKLRIFDTKKAPKVYVFNKNFALVDVYSGVVSLEFLDTFTYGILT